MAHKKRSTGKKQRKLHYLVAVVFVFLALAAWGKSIYSSIKYYKEPAPIATQIDEIVLNTADLNMNGVTKINQDSVKKEFAEANLKIPESLNIKMPFYSQAPFANWDLPYQEACEEASILLVSNLYHQKNWSKKEFNQEILKLVDWQVERFGDYLHTDVQQTAEMIEEYLGLKAKVHQNPSFADIQRIIASGHLIVAPFAGKQLGNPFYSNGGPRYHMMVIKGYDTEKGQIVTHDVGTRRGENYVYSWDVVREALHDWHQSDMNQGAPKLIEVWLDKN